MGLPVSVIATLKLSKSYGRRVGVRSLSLSVEEGELFGFLGPNGSGKTTTIRLLMGLLRPSHGVARVFGRDCWRHSASIKEDVGYLPGDFRVYPWLTCRSALGLFGRIRRRDLVPAGFELADELGLDRDLHVRDMSRGTRQKLGLVLALAHRPRLLILDEPTSALDPVIQEKLCARLLQLASSGHTIFFSSHTLSEVEKLCGRVAILRDGQLLVTERLDALRAKAPRHVTIRWRVGTQPEPPVPPFLQLVDQRSGQWRARLTGAVAELVNWCAAQPIDDLVLEQPDLNHLFQQFYHQGELGR